MVEHQIIIILPLVVVAVEVVLVEWVEMQAHQRILQVLVDQVHYQQFLALQ
jgi:hypothetical protein